MKIIRAVPAFYLFTALWMLTNKQIFEGKIHERYSSGNLMKTGHNIASLFVWNHASLMLIFAIVMTFYWLI